MRKKNSLENAFKKISASIVGVTGLLVFLYAANNLTVTGAAIGAPMSNNIMIIVWGLLIVSAGIWMWHRKDPNLQ